MGENDYMWVAMLKLPECGYLQRDGYDEKPRHSFIIIVVHGHQQAASSSRKLYLCLKGDNKQDTLRKAQAAMNCHQGRLQVPIPRST